MTARLAHFCRTTTQSVSMSATQSPGRAGLTSFGKRFLGSVLRVLATSCPAVLFGVTAHLPAAETAGKSQQLTSLDQVPDGLAKSDWHSIRAAYEAGLHAFHAVEGRWQARNPGQQWTTKFDGRGFIAQPSGAEWQWGLELESYGFAGRERTIGGVGSRPAVKAEGQRLTYAWDDTVQEWFVNDGRGLEHGFTLKQRPPSVSEVPLQFKLEVRGTLVAQVAADGQGVQFLNASGTAVLNYTGLKVWDADGRILASHFEGMGVRRVRLLIEERGARYPLTIDPIAQQAYLKPGNNGPVGDDRFGASVSVSGDTVVVGARGEDSSTTGVNSSPNEDAITSGAAYVFTRSGTTWSQQAYLKANNTGAGDRFGVSVAVSGDTLVVGAYSEASGTTGVNSTPNDAAGNSGAAYVFTRSGTTWSQQAYLQASNTGAGDRFGISVAVSGDTVVVGAYSEASGTTGVNSTPNEAATNSGAAYVFTRSGTTWSQQAYLKANNTGIGDQFGLSVSVSGDTLVVGASGEGSSSTGINSTPNEAATGSGAAYVFIRNGTTWSQQAYLKASNSGGNDQFGTSVAVSGNTIVVGAPQEASSSTGINSTPNDAAGNSGAAYVFTRNGTTWSQQAYLKASNTGASDRFGSSVSVSGDTVVVGAYVEASSMTGVNSTPNEAATGSGAAYVFTRNATTWSQQAYLKASNTGANDFFGFSVSVSGDTVVAGSFGEASSTTGVNSTPNEAAPYAGAAYVFTSNGTTWSQQAYLKAVDALYETGAGDQFGVSVAVSGGTVVIGAFGEASSATGVNGTPNEAAAYSGAAYVFTMSGTTWSQQAYLKASNTGPSDFFGSSVSISGDTLVIGAYGEDSSATGVNQAPNEDAFDSGAAYVFTRNGTTWSQQAYLKASNTGAGDFFGYSVSISGDTLVIGAYGEASSAAGVNGMPNEGSPYSGAAYVFARSGTTWSQEAFLKASNTGADDYFGASVAVSGGTVVIGARGEDSSATGVNGMPNEGSPYSGAAYVFTRSGTTWSQQAYLKASNTGANDYFGTSVAVSEGTVVIGAYGEASSTIGINSTPNEATADSGAAYIFSVPLPDIAVAQAGPLENGKSLDFGPVLVGVSSAPLTFTITNTGNADLTGLVISKDGANSADFIVDATGILTVLTPGNSTTFKLTYSPTALGPRSAAIHIASNDPNKNPFNIALAGKGSNNNPTITPIANQTITEDSNTGALTFTLGDVETQPAELAITGSSSNTVLVQNADIIFGGDGASRSVTVTPVANQFGTTIITVAVDDGSLTTSETFELTVTAVNDAPTITHILDRTIDEDTNTGPIAFTLGDVDNPPPGLTIIGTSSNPELVPNANIVFEGGGASRTVTVTPAAERKGVATITLVVSDGVSTAGDTFVLTVTGPEIEVEQDVTITSGGAQDFGGVSVGSQRQLTFQIVNTGTRNLIITGASTDGPQAGDFSLGTLAPTTLTPATRTPLKVTFVPTLAGYRTATLHISSNDSDEGVFDILLTGTAMKSYAWSNFVGSPGLTGNTDGVGSVAGFAYAGGVSVDGNGNLYVADTSNHTIRKVTQGGEVTTLAGLAGTPGASDGNGSGARFNNPGGVTVDSYGNVFVADTNNHTIRKISSTGLVTTFAGSAGIIGSGDGPGNAARFNYPNGVVVDLEGSVFVADTNNHTIRKITAARAVSTLAGTAGSLGSTDATGSAARFNFPMGIAVDLARRVIVADQFNHTIRRVTSGGVTSTVAGTPGSAGAADGHAATAGFNYPAGVAVDTLGTIFVADTSNGTIRRMESNGWVSTIGSMAGALGFVDGQGVNARFNGPVGIATRSAGVIYVADMNNSRVSRGTAEPEIEVANALGTTMEDGVSSVNFGNVAVGATMGLTFTIRNVGAADLLGLNVSCVGANAGDFTTSPLTSSILTPGGSTSFTVNYHPSSSGSQTATLLISSNDSDEGIFDIALLGNSSALEAWRKANFGSPDNAGAGADLNDIEKDGLVNLVEFSLGLNPKQNSAGSLPQAQVIGTNLVMTVTQPAGVSGITYGAEWSPSMAAGTWLPVADTGTGNQHTFSVPMGTNKRMFMRFKVSSP